MTVITCKECSRTNGTGSVGTSWICEDCKVEMTEQKQQAERDEWMQERRLEQ
ncbi:hypothetical protein [Paenibacillus beijingensis]|uniref:hypothetical protein n=1 Tax=Paenibacillus beijingensis TaxID=1126833 RepID=UPI000AB6E04A|nr:hypothetical protein [Paenibacillus beijingensis]